MTSEIVAEKMDFRTVMSVADDAPAKMVEAIDSYFSQFVQLKGEREDGKFVIDEQPCVKCGEGLNPGLSGALFGKGGFEWGLVHGHGHCRNCGWPAVAHHFVKDADGKEVMTLQNVILQVHPDFVKTKKPDQ